MGKQVKKTLKPEQARKRKLIEKSKEGKIIFNAQAMESSSSANDDVKKEPCISTQIKTAVQEIAYLQATTTHQIQCLKLKKQKLSINTDTNFMNDMKVAEDKLQSLIDSIFVRKSDEPCSQNANSSSDYKRRKKLFDEYKLAKEQIIAVYVPKYEMTRFHKHTRPEQDTRNHWLIKATKVSNEEKMKLWRIFFARISKIAENNDQWEKHSAVDWFLQKNPAAYENPKSESNQQHPKGNDQEEEEDPSK